MDKVLTGFLMTLFCWLTSCICGALIANAIFPVNGMGLTTFDGLVFVAIGWMIFNQNFKDDKEYQVSFNIWMSLLYIPTLLSVL